MSEEIECREYKTITSNPEYVEAFRKFIAESTDNLMKKIDPIYGRIQTVPMEQKSTVVSNTPSGSVLSKPIEVSRKFLVKKDSILDSNANDIVVAIYECAQSGLKSMMPQFYEYLGEMCDASGQSINAKGQPFSYDMILQLLEKVEMTFDEDGNPNSDQVLILPQQIRPYIQKNPPPQDFFEKQKEIIERKKAEYFAKKRPRKLY